MDAARVLFLTADLRDADVLAHEASRYAPDVQFESCFSASDAVQRLAAHRFVAMVVDSLPAAQRRDAIARVRQEAPPLPLIVLVPPTEVAASADLLDAGASVLVPKRAGFVPRLLGVVSTVIEAGAPSADADQPLAVVTFGVEDRLIDALRAPGVDVHKSAFAPDGSVQGPTGALALDLCDVAILDEVGGEAAALEHLLELRGRAPLLPVIALVRRPESAFARQALRFDAHVVRAGEAGAVDAVRDLLPILRRQHVLGREAAGLRANELRIRTIIEAAPAPIALFTTDGLCLAMNWAGLSMLGIGAVDELVGRSFLERVNLVERAEFEAFLEQVGAGETSAVTLSWPSLEGDDRRITVSGVPLLREPGTAFGVLSSLSVVPAISSGETTPTVAAIPEISAEFQEQLDHLLAERDDLMQWRERHDDLSRQLEDSRRAAAALEADLAAARDRLAHETAAAPTGPSEEVLRELEREREDARLRIASLESQLEARPGGGDATRELRERCELLETWLHEAETRCDELNQQLLSIGDGPGPSLSDAAADALERELADARAALQERDALVASLRAEIDEATSARESTLALDQEVTRLLERLQTVEAQLAHATRREQEQDAELAASRAMTTSLTDELHAMGERADVAGAELARMREDLARAAADHDRAADDQGAVAQELERARAELTDLARQLSQSRTDAADLNRRLAQAQAEAAELAVMRARAEALGADMQTALADAARYGAELASLRDRLVQSGDTEAELRAARERGEQELANARANITLLEERLGRLTADHDRADARRAELDHELQRSRAEAADLARQLAASRSDAAELATLRARLAHSGSEHEQVRTSHEKAEQELATARANITALEERLARLAADHDRADTRGAELEHALQRSRAEAADLVRQLAASQGEAAELATLRAHLAHSASEHEQVRAARDAAEAELARLGNAIADLQERLAVAEAERVQVAAGRAVLEGELSRARTEAADLLRQLTQARADGAELAVVRARAEALGTDLQAAVAEAGRYGAEVTSLRDRLAEAIDDKAKSRAARHAIEAELTRARQAAEAAEQQLAQARIELASLASVKATNDTLAAQLTTSAADANRLAMDLAQARAELHRLEAERHTARATLGSVEQDLVRTRAEAAELAAARAANETLGAQLRAATLEQERFTQQLVALRAELGRLDGERRQALSTLDAANRALETARAEHAAEREDLLQREASVDAEIRLLTERCATLEAERDQARAQQSDLEALSLTQQALEEQLRALEADRATHVTRLEERLADVRHLTQQVGDLSLALSDAERVRAELTRARADHEKTKAVLSGTDKKLFEAERLAAEAALTHSRRTRELEAEVAQWRDRSAELVRELEALRVRSASLIDAEHVQRQLEERLQQSEAHRAELAVTLDAARRHAAAHAESLAREIDLEASRRTDFLRVQIDASERKAREWQMRVETLEAALRTADTERDTLATQLEELRSALVAAQRNADDQFARIVGAHDAERAALAAQLADTRRRFEVELASAQRRLEALEQERRRLETTVHELEEARHRLAEEVSLGQRQASAARDEIDLWRQRMAQADVERNELMTRLAMIEAEHAALLAVPRHDPQAVAALVADRETLAAARDVLDEALRVERAHRLELEDALGRAQAGLRDREQRIETLREVIERSREARDRTQAELDALRDAHGALANELEASADARAVAQAALDEVAVRVAMLEPRLAAADEAHRQLAAAHVGERRRARKYANRVNRMRARFERQLARQADLEASLLATARELADVTAVKEALVQRLDGSTIEVETLRAEIDAERDARARQHQTLSALEQQLTEAAPLRAELERALAEASEQRRLLDDYQSLQASLETGLRSAEARLQELQLSQREERRRAEQTLRETNRLRELAREREIDVERSRHLLRVSKDELEKQRRLVHDHMTARESLQRMQEDKDREMQAELARQADERARLQQSLAEALARADRLQHVTFVGMARTTPDGFVLSLNRGLAAMLGLASADDVATASAYLPAPPMVPAGTEIGERMREIGVRRPDGHLVWLVEYAYAVQGGAGEPLVERVFVDVTRAREQASALKDARRLESVGRLTTTMVDDLQRLLAQVRSGVEGLSRRAGQPLAELSASTARAAALVNQLHAHARRQMRDAEAVDVGAVLRQQHTLLRRLVGDDVELSVDEPSQPLLVAADRASLEQLVTGLVMTGRDALAHGGTLALGARLDEKGVERPGLEGRASVVVSMRLQGYGLHAQAAGQLKPAVQRCGGTLEVTAGAADATFSVFVPASGDSA